MSKNNNGKDEAEGKDKFDPTERRHHPALDLSDEEVPDWVTNPSETPQEKPRETFAQYAKRKGTGPLVLKKITQTVRNLGDDSQEMRVVSVDEDDDTMHDLEK